MTKNLFSEFPVHCSSDWERQISYDLKGKPKDSLVTETEDGIKVLPNYFSTTAPQTRSFRNTGRWLIASSFYTNQSNESILNELSGGCNALIIHIYDGVNFTALFDRVMLDIIDCTVVYHGKNVNVVQNELTEYIQANNKNVESLYFVTDILEYCSSENHSFNNVFIDASVYRNAGSTVAEEMTLALTQLTEILVHHPKRVHIQIGIGPDYFIEIAKLRAFRKLVKEVTKAFKWNGEIRISAIPSTYYLSTTEVNNNLLRLTTMAMAAVIGGTDQITLPAFDFSDSSFSKRVTRNIQLILEQEAFLSKVNDPALGTYFIEELTANIADVAWTNFQKLEGDGGFLVNLKNGSIESMINKSHKKRLEQHIKGVKTQIGENENTHDKTDLIDVDVTNWNGIKQKNLSIELKMEVHQ